MSLVILLGVGMKRSYVFGLLLSGVFVVPAYAQGLKINPFPTAEQAPVEQSAPAASNTPDFTQEALKQLGEERASSGAAAPKLQTAPQQASGGGQIFRVDPVPMLEPVTPSVAPPSIPSTEDEARYEQAISDFDSPVLPEPVHMQPQEAHDAAVKYVTNVPGPASAQPKNQAFEDVLQRTVYEEEYMREVQQQMTGARDAAQAAPVVAASTQEPVSLRRVPIVVLEEKTNYQDLEPAAAVSAPQGWSVSQDQSVRDALERWSAAEGVSLIWDSQVDFMVVQGFSESGAYEDAVSKLLDQHVSEGLRPVGKLYADPVTGVRVLTVKAVRS